MTSLLQETCGRVAGLLVGFILIFDASPRADAASNPPLSELSDLIVNSERGGQASDELFYRETLQMVDTYRKAGGRPTRWFVQSWYPYPNQILPETAPHSMTTLVKAVIERVSDRPVVQSRTGLAARSRAETPDQPPPVTAVDSIRRTESGAILAETRVTSTGAEPPLADRISTRSFPSVFQAWNTAESVDDPSPLHTVARHDLVFHAPEFFGLRWNHRHTGLADGFSPESMEAARAFRQKLLELNPRLVLLTEIRYRDAPKSYLPEGHSWWLRDAEGRLVSGWEEGGFLCLNFHDPEYRSRVVKQAKAAVESGAVDGVMLDWWSDDASRLALVKELRQAVGDDALIMANANDRTTPQTAPYLNGYFMECYKSQTAQDWQRIADTLAWAEEHLRPPRVNCLETWFHKSREDLDLMRATTTLALTHSDGYCLFSDPNPLPKPDHLHNWYPFWNKRLGRPRAKGQKLSDGTHRREFEQGTVVYNPMGNQPVRVTFAQLQISLATGKRGLVHRLGSPDGDIYLSDELNGIVRQTKP